MEILSNIFSDSLRIFLTPEISHEFIDRKTGIFNPQRTSHIVDLRRTDTDLLTHYISAKISSFVPSAIT